jgi:hypothetical protein
MKKISFIFAFLAVICFLELPLLYADWGPETRLTFDSGYSGNRPSNRWIACGLLGNVHIVWQDDRDGNFEIYYKQRINGSWDNDFRITYDDSVSLNPAVVVDSTDTVYVAWEDNRDGNFEIYFSKKINDSLWSNPIKVSDSPGNSINPSISGLGQGILHIVWQDETDGDFEIYYKKREQDGTWNPDTQLTYTNEDCENPSIIGGDGGYILSWQDWREADSEIYWKLSYSTEQKITFNTLRDEYPMASFDSDFGYPGVYFQSDSAYNGGVLPGFRVFAFGFGLPSVMPMTNWDSLNSDSKHPSADIRSTYTSASGLPCVVWQDDKDGNFEIYGYEAGFQVFTRISDDDSQSINPAMVSDPRPPDFTNHIVWMDNRDGNFEIYYRYFQVGSSIEEDNKKEGKLSKRILIIYPNPFITSTRLRISGKKNIKGSKLHIYDASGRLVKSIKLAIDTYELGTDLKAGIYFLKLNGESVGKMVKVR